DALTVQIVAKDNFDDAVEAVYRELLRAQRGGFTESEYDRARADYLSHLEKAYNSRDSRQTAAYVDEYVNNFIKNEPIPSIEDEYALMTQLSQMVDVNVINQILPDLVTDDNRVFLFMAPLNDTFKVPVEADIAAVVAAVDAEDIEPYKDAMKAEPLIPQLPTPGKVVSITDDAQWGAKLVTLSNGLKVYVKPTDFKKDDIRFEAIALGGNSSLSDSELNTLMGATLAFIQHGLGDYTNSDLRKYLQGKQAGVAFSIEDYTRQVSGTTTVKDLPTMMEMIYMTFVDFTVNENDFKSSQTQLAAQFASLMGHPEILFEKTVMDALYTSPLNHFPSQEVIMAADRETGVNYIRKSLANAADYTFFFVGDIDMDTLIPLLEQYIATLPADAATATRSYTPNAGLEIRAGKGTDNATAKMETPQVYADVIISGNLDYTPKNRILATIVSQVLSTRLHNKVREEMGATYGIGAQGEMSRAGNVNTVFQIKFPMKPELKDEVLAEVDNIVASMTQNVTDEELNPVKEFMLKTYAEQKELNSGWIGAMTATQINGVDFFNGVEETVNSITTADIQNFMQQLLGLGNYRVVILDPEQ
ncbi:MAG: insulinase family protein, partial [Muribaculaceae bacterium]|nr:insulinase family protein [Muribaculaceae bacterium]